MRTSAHRRFVADLGGWPASDVLAAFVGLLLPDIVNNYRPLVGIGPKLRTSARMLSGTMADSHLLRKRGPLDFVDAR